MIRLCIDNKPVVAAEGTTVLEAASLLGIEIPALCHLKGIQTQPSCMVCTVKDNRSGKLFPSCATMVTEGMDITTDSADLENFRKEAIELLLSDHVGDCEAPCRLTCPAGMNIPLMNRLIADGRFEEALAVVHQEIALPLVLGYICPAPCEKACKRKPVDAAVSICLLKRFTADDPVRYSNSVRPAVPNGKRVAIIGTGPAGLSAAFYLLRAGYACVLFDKQEQAGGALRYSIPEAELPAAALDAEIEKLRSLGAQFILEKVESVTNLKANGYGVFNAYILATGSQEVHPLEGVLESETPVPHHFFNRETFQTSEPDVFACGSIIREVKMAVRSGAQGKAAALSVMHFLEGKELTIGHSRFNSSFGQLFKEEYPHYLKESIPDGRIIPVQGFLGGFSQEEARNEASRCMHCDCRKPESCKLRNLSDLLGADQRRYDRSNRKMIRKDFENEWIVFEPEKCVKCGICIEIASRETDALGLTFVGRGFNVKVSVPLNGSMREAIQKLAGECASACPTGALSARNLEERLPDR